jgi:hypothetical protein
VKKGIVTGGIALFIIGIIVFIPSNIINNIKPGLLLRNPPPYRRHVLVVYVDWLGKVELNLGQCYI